uniref:GCN5-related N-acetyltransferase Rv2170-like domain-containing protein n=1 Tax=Anopheles arabiensis TaxID=7173 RepID=A0A182ID04_ANOAR
MIECGDFNFTEQRHGHKILFVCIFQVVHIRYGIQLAQSLTKLVIRRGYIPFVVIRPENDASRGLYTKLGFRKAFESVRGTFVPLVGENHLQNNLTAYKQRQISNEENCTIEPAELTNGIAS